MTFENSVLQDNSPNQLPEPSPKNNLREDLLDILPRTNAPSRPASTVDRRRNTKTFHPFPRLPKELQQKVWSYTFPSDRRFPLEIFMRFWDGPLWPFRGAPAPYSMDKAGYEFSLKHYHDIWAWIPTSGIPYQRCMKPYFFNVKKDYFTLNLATLVRIGNRPMEIYSHDSVKWCLENNPNREIIEQADVSLVHYSWCSRAFESHLSLPVSNVPGALNDHLLTSDSR